MNVLATGVSDRVHYTETPVRPDWPAQIEARPACRKVMITGYVTTVEDALDPVNCPRCIAKTDTVQEETMSSTERETEARAAEVEAYNLAEAERARDENEGPGGMYHAEAARHFTPAEVAALLDPATDRPTPLPPVTVAEAMATVLHLGRKLDVTTGQVRELEELADLTERLGLAVRTAANVITAQLVAGRSQHAVSPSGKAYAAATAATAKSAREAALRAHERLSEGIVAYGQRR